jgi:hypothetical protein
MNLSPREKTIIDFLSEMRTAKEIAEKLGVKNPPSEVIARLKNMKLIERIDIPNRDVLYKATPWQNRPCVLGVRF